MIGRPIIITQLVKTSLTRLISVKIGDIELIELIKRTNKYRKEELDLEEIGKKDCNTSGPLLLMSQFY